MREWENEVSKVKEDRKIRRGDIKRVEKKKIKKMWRQE